MQAISHMQIILQYLTTKPKELGQRIIFYRKTQIIIT